MSKKLNMTILVLVLALVLNLCFINAAPVLAKNAYNSYINNKHTNTKPPGKTIGNDVIIAFLVPYVQDAFTKENIEANKFSYDTTSVMSIKSMPNNRFEIKLYINTYSTPPFEPPFGYYHVTVITDGISVDIIDIHESGNQKLNAP